MIEEVEPLKALQDPVCSPLVIDRVGRDSASGGDVLSYPKGLCPSDKSDESVFDTSSSSTTERLLRPLDLGGGPTPITRKQKQTDLLFGMWVRQW
jgi:hypothetical protein